MRRIVVLSILAPAAVLGPAQAAEGVRLSGAELRRLLPGRTLDYNIVQTSRWFTWALERGGSSRWSWASREYRVRWKIERNRLCYFNRRRRGWLCGAVYRTGRNKYEVRDFRGAGKVGARFTIRR